MLHDGHGPEAASRAGGLAAKIYSDGEPKAIARCTSRALATNITDGYAQGACEAGVRAAFAACETEIGYENAISKEVRTRSAARSREMRARGGRAREAAARYSPPASAPRLPSPPLTRNALPSCIQVADARDAAFTRALGEGASKPEAAKRAVQAGQSIVRRAAYQNA